MIRVAVSTVGGEIGAAFPKRFGERTVFSRLEFFGSFLKTSHTGIIRALLMMGTQCFSQVQVKVGVVHFCRYFSKHCIFAHIGQGRMRPALVSAQAFPFVGKWANPDKVRTNLSWGAAPNFNPVRKSGPTSGNSKMTQKISDQTKAIITEELHRTMLHLFGVQGCSVPEILVVTHAEIITQIAGFFGGSTAVEICEMAAKRVALIPPHSRIAAAATAPVGVMQ